MYARKTKQEKEIEKGAKMDKQERDESIKKDSDFSLPWTYTAMCYLRNASNSNQNDFKEASTVIRKALPTALDPSKTDDR